MASDSERSAAASELVGATFGPLTIEAPLGSGGMGVVYRARHAERGLVCAKVLAPEHEARGSMLRRFRREALGAKKLRHPNVVRSFGLLEIDDYQVLVCELVEGHDLAEHLRLAGGALPVKESLRIARDIASGLSAAHEAGLVHRDLKPGNVLLDAEGNAKVADFGLVLQVDGEPLDGQTILTQKGAVLGTPMYMAPEQWRGAHDVDGRADLYALGVLLYQCLSGWPPFTADTVADLMVAHLQEAPFPLRNHAPHVPMAVCDLVMELLAKTPDERPRDAAVTADRIAGLAAHRSVAQADPPARPGRPAAPAPGGTVSIAGPDGSISEEDLAPPPAEVGLASGSEPGDLIGAVIAGKFEVRGVLGRGGMGTVYRVWHRLLEEEFALKFLRGRGQASREFRERFLREAKALLAFSHEGAVGLREFGEHDGALFMTQDLAPGQTLATFLAVRGRSGITAETTLEIARQLLTCLHAAHEAGLVHRDLKPENLMIDRRPDGSLGVKILDFGIAKILSDAAAAAGDDVDLTATGTALGTPSYMSPEQAAGDPVDRRSDVYSAAAILYECLSGRLPIVAKSQQELLYKIVMQPPPPLIDEAGDRASLALCHAVEAGLAKKREDRPATAAELLERLESAQAVAPEPARRDGGKRRRTARSPRTGPTQTLAGVGSKGPRGTIAITAASSPTELLGQGWRPSPAPPPRRGGPVVALGVSAIVLALAAAGVAIVLGGRGAANGDGDDLGRLRFTRLDPPAGVTVWLAEPRLRVSGRLSDRAAGPVRIGERGGEPIEVEVPWHGRFEALVELSPGATDVEVRAGRTPVDVLATIPVVIDVDPPAPRIEAPEGWAPGSPLVATIRAGDAHPAWVRVALRLDGRVVGDPVERTPDADGVVEVELAPPPAVARAEAFEVTVIVRDRAGHEASASAPVAVSKDGPAIEIESPDDRAVTAARTIELRAQVVGDRPRGDVVVAILLDAEEVAVRTITRREDGLVHDPRLDLPPEDGEYRIEVRAVDRHGHRSRRSVALRVDRTPPEVEVTMPAAGAVTNAHELEVRIDARDPSGVARVEVSAPNGPIPFERDPETTEVWVGRAPLPEEDGPADVSLLVEDAAGASVTVPVAVVVDRTPPSVEARAAGRHVRVDVVDASPIAAATLDGRPLPRAEDGSFAGDAEVADTGKSEAKVEVVDAAGNVGRATVTIDVDRTAPSVRVEAPDRPPSTYAGSIPIRVRAAGASRVTLADGTDLVRGEDGAWRGSWAIPYAGRQVTTVTARDAAGNEAKAQIVATRLTVPEEVWWTPTAEQLAAAAERGWPLFFESAVGMRFVLVPGGTFAMGSPEDEPGRSADDEASHSVTLSSPYYVAADEVGNGVLRRFRPDHSSGRYRGQNLDRDDQPAVEVSWATAVAFARWCGEQEGDADRYALPTEAEWERAARAGTTGRWFWGDDAAKASRFANVPDRSITMFLETWEHLPVDDGHAVASPLASFAPNPFGLHDVIGNVGEWCADRFAAYPEGEAIDPTGPAEGEARAIRGGSWYDRPACARAAYRRGHEPTYRSRSIGFRVVTRSPPGR